MWLFLFFCVKYVLGVGVGGVSVWWDCVHLVKHIWCRFYLRLRPRRLDSASVVVVAGGVAVIVSAVIFPSEGTQLNAYRRAKGRGMWV